MYYKLLVCTKEYKEWVFRKSLGISSRKGTSVIQYVSNVDFFALHTGQMSGASPSIV